MIKGKDKAKILGEKITWRDDDEFPEYIYIG
jgi:hypothetical protein